MKYTAFLRKDLAAGLMVFLVALPLCMGIAMASGAPLMSGIISGIIGGVVVGLLSGSSLSVSGPAAGLTVVVFQAVAQLGWEAVLLATVMAGVIQLLLGTLRSGFIAHYFPQAVVHGMLAAIGILLVLKQLPYWLGVKGKAFGEMEFWQHDGGNTFSQIAHAFEQFHPGAVVIGILSLLLLIISEWKAYKQHPFFGKVPMALLLVVLSVGVNTLFAKFDSPLFLDASYRVTLPNTREGFQFLSWEVWHQLKDGRFYRVVLSIALIASLETLLSLEAVDKIDPLKRKSPHNQELKAQGVGNILSGLLGGLPMTAVIVRSSANVTAGGMTKLATILHGLFLGIAVFLFPDFLQQIPLTTLAAILIVVGFKLTAPKLYREQWILGKPQFLPFVLTIIAILFTDLLMGVLIGLFIGVYFVLREHHEKALRIYRRPGEHEQEEVLLELGEHISFLHKAELIQLLNNIPMHSHVVIDGERTRSIDHDVLIWLAEFKLEAREKRIDLQFKGLSQLHP